MRTDKFSTQSYTVLGNPRAGNVLVARESSKSLADAIWQAATRINLLVCRCSLLSLSDRKIMSNGAVSCEHNQCVNEL